MLFTLGVNFIDIRAIRMRSFFIEAQIGRTVNRVCQNVRANLSLKFLVLIVGEIKQQFFCVLGTMLYKKFTPSLEIPYRRLDRL